MKKRVRLILALVLAVVFMTNSMVSVRAADSWTALKTNMAAKRAFASVTVNDKIYNIGGYISGALNTIEEYDPVTKTCTNVGTLVNARYFCSAAVVNGKVYIFGGHNSTYVGAVEEFDPVTKKTKVVANIVPRYGMAIAVLNNSIYLMGGYDSAGYQKTVVVFNPQDYTSNENVSPALNARGHARAAVINNKIYLTGGFSGTAYGNTCEVYDPLNDTWTPLASMNYNRAYHGLEAIDGKLYAFGGWNGTNIYTNVDEFDPQTNRWTEKSGKLTARFDFGYASINNKIYVLGGANTTNYAIVNTVEVYDKNEDNWVKGEEIKNPRYFARAVEVDGKIYLVGGTNGATSIAKTEMFDPVSNAWVDTKDEMKFPRYGMAVVKLDGKIYAIGGYNGGALRTVEVYDPVVNKWVKISDMTTPRYYAAATVYNGKIYVFGGNNGAGLLKNYEEYDPVTNNWILRGTIPTPREGASAVTCNDKIYIMGGSTAANVFTGIVEEFNPVNRSWGPQKTAMTPRVHPSLEVMGGRIYAIGGYNGAPMIKNEEYDPSTDTWISRGSMPLAKYAAASAVMNGKVYIIGGYTASGAAKGVEEYVPPRDFIENIKVEPEISTSSNKVLRGQTLEITVRLKDTQGISLTNGCEFEFKYDGTAFELLTGNVENDVVNGYIPFTLKKDLGSGTGKRIYLAYESLNDINIREGERLFTLKLKTKSDAAYGDKTFTLSNATIIDSYGIVYNVNDETPITQIVEVANSAVVEGFVSFYLGEGDLGTMILNRLVKEKISTNCQKLVFTLKHNAADTGTQISGKDVFVPDENGNLAVVDQGKLKGKIRLFTTDTTYTILRVSGSGYLAKEFTINLTAGNVYSFSTQTLPALLYPGDIGQIQGRKLLRVPDGKISIADKSVWQMIYNEYIKSIASMEDMNSADFTKDGIIDNLDFSLWKLSRDKVVAF